MLAEALVERVLGEGAEVARPLPRRRACSAPATSRRSRSSRPRRTARRATPSCPADFVTAEDGTGIVHTAIAFGEDDFRLGARAGPRPSSTRCGSTAPTTSASARTPAAWSRTPTPTSIEDLRARGRLLRAERLRARLPALLALRHAAALLRQALLVHPHVARCATGCWPPTRRSTGTRRTSSTGASATGWRTTSTGRSRASATGARRCRSGAARTATSSASARSPSSRSCSGGELHDPHRPYVDERHAGRAPSAASAMRRVPEVIDVWFDSGSMPFAQWHAPFENEERFERDFPADYICEAIDQTRGWFYSLLAISTLLFDRAPYRNVLCLGLHRRRRGQEDVQVARATSSCPGRSSTRHGADAFRWYFFTSKQPWDGYRFSLETVGESVRQFLLQLWNTYGFYVLYANVNDVAAARGRAGRRDLDRWALSRLDATIATVRERLDAYDATSAGRAIAALRRRALELVRAPLAPALLGRRPGGLRDAARTAWSTVAQAARAVLPVPGRRDLRQPRRLRAERAPVRLPGGRRRATTALERAMAVARETVRLGLAARGQAKLKVRQPLRAAVVVAAGAERDGDRAARATSCARSSTSRSCASSPRPTSSAPTRSSRTTARSGPRFGKHDAAGRGGGRGARPGARRRRRCATAAASASPSTATTTSSAPDDLHARDAAARGLPARARGLARRRARARARRRAAPRGPRARDRARRPERAQGRRPRRSRTASRSALGGDDELLAAAREHEAYVAGETLAVARRATTRSTAARRRRSTGRDRCRIASRRRAGAA